MSEILNLREKTDIDIEIQDSITDEVKANQLNMTMPEYKEYCQFLAQEYRTMIGTRSVISKLYKGMTAPEAWGVFKKQNNLNF